MITNDDVKKLKTVFATKDDLKKFATNDDLKRLEQKIDVKFASKDDLRKTKQELLDKIDDRYSDIWAESW